jgi:hypothetical protein
VEMYVDSARRWHPVSQSMVVCLSPITSETGSERTASKHRNAFRCTMTRQASISEYRTPACADDDSC